jgi:hemerythrin-like domain-containing protein
MREAGIPSSGGPVGVMLEEHAEARQLTAAMRAGAERMESGDADAHEEVARSALGYVALLRMHIAKEDQAFFPMAEDAIQGSAREEIAEAFERIEREEVAQGVHERYLSLAASLEREASL